MIDRRVAIITGGGRGIGRGIACAFAASGIRVLVATRSAANGLATIDAIRAAGGAGELIVADIGCADGCSNVVEGAIRTYDGVDILIHNAGIFPYAPIETQQEDDLDRVLSVNLKAAFRLSRAALAHLKRSGRGRILLTSSVTGPLVAMPGYAAYAASKAGLNGFIRTAALEYARFGITVNGVAPGFILTPGTDTFPSEAAAKEMRSHIPAGRFGLAEDVAATMLFLAGEQAGYITGQTIVVDGGASLPENQRAFARYR